MTTKSFAENAFFMFYGLIVGVVIGVYGNLWAQLFYDYFIKDNIISNPDLRGIYFWLCTAILIVMCSITAVLMVHFWRRSQRCR